MSSPLLTDAEPEPFEVLGAPPIVSIDSLSRALSPAVSSSLSRHPDARPGHIGMHLLSWLEGRPPPDAPPMAPRMVFSRMSLMGRMSTRKSTSAFDDLAELSEKSCEDGSIGVPNQLPDL